MKFIYLLLVCFITPSLFSEEGKNSGELSISITGFLNSNGQAIIRVYDSSDGFPKDGRKAYKILKSKIINKAVNLKLSEIPAGNYAVMAFHDENNNGVIDKSSFGFPKEPIGISNYPKISRPDFKKAKFTISKGEAKKCSIKVQKF